MNDYSGQPQGIAPTCRLDIVGVILYGYPLKIPGNQSGLPLHAVWIL